MNRTITFFDEMTGEPHEYLRYSARLEAFNEKFGPGTGYRVESSLCGLLDLQPGRMAAVKEAAANGLKPQDCGLGKLSNMMVCTHRLLDTEGNVVADAHAAMMVAGHKQLECLATASHQRLMAKVGIGGDIFDEDEDLDIATAAAGDEPETAEDEQPARQAETAPAAEATAQQPAAPQSDPSEEAKPAKQAKPRQSARKGAAAKKATNGAKAAEAAPEAEEPDKGSTWPKAPKAPPPAMIRQLEGLAERAGEEVPTVTTFAQAKAELKRLTQRANDVTAS